MSRSRKKTKIQGFAIAASEARDKRVWHGRMRAAERDRLITDPESEPTHQNQVCNPWCMAKDGKCYWIDMPSEQMRK